MPIPLLAAAGIGAGADFLGQYLGHRLNAGLDQKNLARLMALFSPASVGAGANQFFDIFQHSPMYTAMRGRAMEGANILGNQIRTNYAQRGLGRSGFAAMTEPIARASVLGGFNNIDMDLFKAALAQYMGGANQIGSYMAGHPLTSPFGQAMGGTIGDLGPLFANYMQNTYPNQLGPRKVA